MPSADVMHELRISGEPTRDKCKRCGKPIERYGKYAFNPEDYKRAPGAMHIFSCGEVDDDETGGGELPPVPDQTLRTQE
jgi:hypothetical protein